MTNFESCAGGKLPLGMYSSECIMVHPTSRAKISENIFGGRAFDSSLGNIFFGQLSC